MKFTSSKEKAILPGRKQSWRRCKDGKYLEDIITLWDEQVDDAEPLMVPIIVEGELVYDFPETEHIRKYARENLAALPEEYRRITESSVYPVKSSEALTRLRDELFEQYSREYLE